MKVSRFPATSHVRSSCWTAVVAIALLSSALPALCADSLTQPTTYAELTQKNSSAALNFTEQVEGTPSENVSKVSIASVLPTGTSAHIYAHFLSWFGTAGHQDVGYSSADALQVQKQITDMLSRGINGVIVNWHGPADFTNQSALLIMAEAESHTGNFEFSIEEDSAAFADCAATSGCDLAAKIASDVTYIQSTYATAKSYMKFQDRPVIFFYGMEAYKLDWDKIRASLSGNPVLIFRPRPATSGSGQPSRSAVLAPGTTYLEMPSKVSRSTDRELQDA